MRTTNSNKIEERDGTLVLTQSKKKIIKREGQQLAKAEEGKLTKVYKIKLKLK